MTLNIVGSAAALGDDALLARVQALVDREREVTSELIAHLAELDTRQVLVAEGFSLFTYCTRRLGFSEDAAYTRVEVARASRRFPVILEGLADGSLTLTTIRLPGRHLTAENHGAVLAKARCRSNREVEVLVAELAPRPDVPSSVRRIAVAPPAEPPRAPSTNGAPLPEVMQSVSPAPGAPPCRPPVMAPLSPERYRMQFTVDKEIRRPATDAPSARSWKSTTSIPTRWVGRRRWRTWPCAAGGTMSTRPSSPLAPASCKCAKLRFPTAAVPERVPVGTHAYGMTGRSVGGPRGPRGRAGRKRRHTTPT
jgi:hypothetical protein